MTKLKIPEHYKVGFKILLNLNQDEVDILLNLLKSIQVESSKDSYIEQIAKNSKLSHREVNELMTMLLSLYHLKQSREESTDEIVADLCNVLVESDEKELLLSDKTAKQFQQNLIKLLSFDSTLGIKTKAIKFAAGFDKLFCSSEIITDIRPIISKKIDPTFGLIIHNLKVKYHEGPDYEDKEIIIRLDDEDLNKLKKQIIETEKRNKLLKEKIKGVVNIINIENI